jgi:hypothetical protein
MKKLSLLFYVATISIFTYGQSHYSETDLQGEWQHARGYTIKIENSQAKISRVKDPFPAKVIGGIFYSNITYVEDGVWTAQNRVWQWRVNDIQNGWWKDMGKVTIKLSKDKMTLSDGARSLSRLKGVEKEEIDNIANNLEPNSKKVYKANYGDLALEYTIGKTSSGKIVIHVKGRNNGKDVVAVVKYESEGKTIIDQKINPGQGFSGPIPFDTANLTVTFEAFKPGDNSPDLIQILRKKFEEELTIKDNDLVIKKRNVPTGVGVRG